MKRRGPTEYRAQLASRIFIAIGGRFGKNHYLTIFHERAMLSQFTLPLFLVLATQSPAPIPNGVGKCTIDVDKHALECFTYRPKQYKDGPLIVVFHGMLRNADTYRDNAIGLADRHGALVVSPEFDQKRFNNEAYQSGGLFKKGQLQPQDQWTWSLVPKLVDEIRKREDKPKMPYYLIGHSAGGQFLCRLTGF